MRKRQWERGAAQAWTHTHMGAHTCMSDAFHLLLYIIVIFNTMNMYLKTIMFIFPLKFSFKLYDSSSVLNL